MTYSLYRNSDKGLWKIVKRIPNGFEAMFNNEASIYTLSDLTFKNINTGFSEVVSEIGVDVIKEEKIAQIFDYISKSFSNISKDIIAQIKEYYTFDSRSFSQMIDEIRNEINKLISMTENSLKNNTTQHINPGR